MKKVILSAVFAMVAMFAVAQSSTKNLQALEILKVTPEVYAQKIQAEVQEVCLLKPAQAEQVYKFAKTTAEKIHKLEKINNGIGNPDHEAHVKKTLQYGEAYIMNILDRNQLAAYNKKDRILRKEELIKEREEMAKKAAKRN